MKNDVEMRHSSEQGAATEKWKTVPVEATEAAREQLIDRIAQWLHDETEYPEHSYPDFSWPLHDADTGQREGGGWVSLVPIDVVEQFREIVRRMLCGFPALAAAPTPAPSADGVREAATDAATSLAAAISLLERSPKTAAPSNKMFDQMLADYRVSLKKVRAALASQPAPVGDGVREALARGYELMHRTICIIAGTSGADRGWYQGLAQETAKRVDPLWKLTADSNPSKPGDCLKGLPAALAAPKDAPAQGGEVEAVAWRRRGKHKWFYRETPPTAQSGDGWLPLVPATALASLQAALNEERSVIRAIVEAAGPRDAEDDIIQHVRKLSSLQAKCEAAERERIEAERLSEYWKQLDHTHLGGMNAATARAEAAEAGIATTAEEARRDAFHEAADWISDKGDNLSVHELSGYVRALAAARASREGGE